MGPAYGLTSLARAPGPALSVQSAQGIAPRQGRFPPFAPHAKVLHEQAGQHGP